MGEGWERQGSGEARKGRQDKGSSIDKSRGEREGDGREVGGGRGGERGKRGGRGSTYVMGQGGGGGGGGGGGEEGSSDPRQL